ncbi:hypothetical protein ACHAXR_004059 [Thalassiosira sp. AJA248-18]
MLSFHGRLSTDSLSLMMEQERTVYSCSDYLNCGGDDDRDSNNDGHKCRNKITSDDRMKVVDWCYQIIDQCGFARETVSFAMNLADRFMSMNTTLAHRSQDVLYDREQYQLVALTALYISIKLNERMAIGSSDFAAVSSGKYSLEDIEEMEREILQCLQWRLCPPTSLQVAYHILSLMPPQVKETIKQGTWNFVEEEMKFQAESAVREYYFMTQRPSTIAMAAIVNSIEQVNDLEYGHLSMALSRILEEFDFDHPRLILKTTDQLHRLMCYVDAARPSLVGELLKRKAIPMPRPNVIPS